MSRHWAIGLVAIGLLLSLSASAVAQGKSTPSNEFRFIGFTGDATNALPDTIDSGQGMLAMHALCRDDFGENARMCTSEEFWLSPNATAAANSWLLKHCTSWATASSTIWGLVVKPEGKPSKGMGEAHCDIARPVTCCAPIQ